MNQLFNKRYELCIQIFLRNGFVTSACKSNCFLFKIGVTPKEACFHCTAAANSTEVTETISKWAYRIDKVRYHHLLAFGPLRKSRVLGRSVCSRLSIYHVVTSPFVRLSDGCGFGLRRWPAAKTT